MSTTDPDSTYATKGGTPARLGYYDNYLVDNHGCVLISVAQSANGRTWQPALCVIDVFSCGRGLGRRAPVTFNSFRYTQHLLVSLKRSLLARSMLVLGRLVCEPSRLDSCCGTRRRMAREQQHRKRGQL